jgi:choice-of-anchor A domain-containing protein
MLTLLMVSMALHLGAQTSVNNAVTEYSQLIHNYNLISLGSATFDNYGDTEGPLAINGNLTLTGSGAVATQPAEFGLTSNPTLYVNGQLTLGGTNMLNSGYASLPNLTGTWTWNASQKTLTGGGGALSSINSSSPQAGNNPRTNPAPSGWNWSTLSSSFTAISNTLAAATTNGTITISGQTMSFVAPTGMTSGVAVFTLNAALLNGDMYNGTMFSNVQFNVPNNIDFVINVINAAGTTIFGTGVNFNSGGNYDQLLWNIEPTMSGGHPVTTSVSLGNGGDFYGSVLAPEVDISNACNAIIDGQVVAANFDDEGAELHYTGFVAVLVPEPGTYGAGAVVLCGLAIAWRHRRNRSGLGRQTEPL